jgi:hypothetical protein
MGLSERLQVDRVSKDFLDAFVKQHRDMQGIIKNAPQTVQELNNNLISMGEELQERRAKEETYGSTG